ncbi:16S rRNA (guanine(966)-N(2))-methyltransferase RsmD [Oceanotoga sp. DSM 15011]|jgi:16S rRNA (guanine(966)-N(2))-methyltransferase RsmD|uniref:16S rRNA (Guanine(966)-N(2))-methyltransferase RsmD n=1 Tax=Oceanotoga teriensis TaxID=515440 RepID=A0AA45C972_9BACT|nr:MULTISPECIES: 16S rRNA (guanine(966)-N(2))-methyltransferase RsmD [Oceanotoga]MDN5343595.1 rRNA (guanine966-N2)-methyltransferase [Oceanotoga sp.]MDO7977125.1 16S rRNA (guanine(966)-N(2))-methyltransferase RsmD [Oceanotoga teriensis]PWJ96604.1 16S rRNA (guanine(966)-N(2))-methyltransferase RsmD [Oceanotoga teriensis]UYP00224.1 16S rRNA (guanine(966)-N(2))-methyltransferase RsmD [Oceanotoga sp. DSM 15011]
MLKIETGYLKGSSFDTVPSKKTRYTPSQLRRTLINIFEISDYNLLEVFGGSGSFSFEAISNYAKSSTIIEQSSKSVNIIKNNSKKLGIENEINVIKGDFRTIIPELKKNNQKYDMIFADPPFNLGFVEEFLKVIDNNSEILIDGAYIIIEKSKRENYNYTPLNLELDEIRNYGDIDLLIYFRK